MSISQGLSMMIEAHTLIRIVHCDECAAAVLFSVKSQYLLACLLARREGIFARDTYNIILMPLWSGNELTCNSTV